MPVDPAFVASLYDAACGGDDLGGVASLIGGTIGVEGAAITVIKGTAPLEAYSSPAIRNETHLYQAYYHRLDPWHPRGMARGVDTVVLANELFPESELVKTEFYQDFARPMGMFRPLSAYLRLAPDEHVAVGVEQPFATKLLAPPDKKKLAALAPFLKRAMTLRLSLGRARAKADLGLAALDALKLGVAVTGADGSVRHANPAVTEIATKTGAVGLANGRLVGRTGPGNAALQGAIATASRGHFPDGALWLPNADATRAVSAVVTPLPGSVNGGGPAGLVMVTLRAVGERNLPPAAALQEMWGLSPRQSEIARDIATGRTVGEIAAHRGLRVSTVRSHVAEILARCGVATQRDLVAKMLENAAG